jgi:hypothetical protein
LREFTEQKEELENDLYSKVIKFQFLVYKESQLNYFYLFKVFVHFESKESENKRACRRIKMIKWELWHNNKK